MTKPQFLYAFVDADLESVEASADEALTLAVSIVVVDAAHFRAHKEWDDRDPFAPLDAQFHLSKEMECVYGAGAGVSDLFPAIIAFAADPRFQRDQTIIP